MPFRDDQAVSLSNRIFVKNTYYAIIFYYLTTRHLSFNNPTKDTIFQHHTQNHTLANMASPNVCLFSFSNKSFTFNSKVLRKESDEE